MKKRWSKSQRIDMSGVCVCEDCERLRNSEKYLEESGPRSPANQQKREFNEQFRYEVITKNKDEVDHVSGH